MIERIQKRQDEFVRRLKENGSLVSMTVSCVVMGIGFLFVSTARNTGVGIGVALLLMSWINFMYESLRPKVKTNENTSDTA